MTNPFVLEKSDYKREINPVQQYCDQAAEYLSVMTGTPKADCHAFVLNGLRDKSFGSRDPAMKYLVRQDNQDRVLEEGTLMGYISDSLRNRELIAPTLTTYLHPDVKESLLVNFVEDNIADRGVFKKAMFAAEALKDKARVEGDELGVAMHSLTEAIKNIGQTGTKLSNNAVSGGHVSPSTVLFNRTAHSTLTSNCRSTSGYGNANNEKLLSGNRHYWGPHIVVNNITSIISNTNYQMLDEVMNKYNLVYPTANQVLDVITFSTNEYWISSKALSEIAALVDRLTPIQRAAFVYTGDIYHLMVFNQDVVRGFIQKLSSKKEGNHPDAMKALKEVHEDYVILAHQICSSEMKDKGKDYKAMLGTQELSNLALTAEHVRDTLLEYMDFIRTFFVTKNVPASMAYFPESIRRAAITSDTDSTIFTVQDWVIWYKGKIVFDDEAYAVAATMIFIASQAITHVLARMSANFGIVEKRIHRIAMKNEFLFPVFAPTNLTKHYYASIWQQEGNIYGKLKREVKGVHLKSSNAPKKIIASATELMNEIMDTVMAGKKIKLTKILKDVGDLERSIIASITRGDTEYFRLGQINSIDAYKNPNVSQYVYDSFWNDVFAPKYGFPCAPPYQTVRVSTKLDSPTLTKQWVDEMKDKEMAERMRAWFTAKGKTNIPSLMLPLEYVRASGLPPEIVEAVDMRKIVADLTNIFYIILETLGVYMKNRKNTVLVSDYY